MPTSAPVGTAQQDFVEVAASSWATVSVPAGEQWKFTLVAATQGDNTANATNSRNDSVRIGINNGSYKHAIARTSDNKGHVVGGTPDQSSGGSGGLSLTVDGDNSAGLAAYNSDASPRVVYWAATRVS